MSLRLTPVHERCSLKKICCMQGGWLGADCAACMYRGYCPYSYIFESPAETFCEQGASHKHMHHPFVLEPGDMNTRIPHRG